jgi:hypothetical protein
MLFPRHNYFSDSEWAMKPEERASIDGVVERHPPPTLW